MEKVLHGGGEIRRIIKCIIGENEHSSQDERPVFSARITTRASIEI